MKKNLMSVIILALVFANFVLTAILTFTIYPQTKKANAMIEAVCEAIDLELNSGAATGLSNLPIDQITTYAVNSGETMTINLADGEHYAVISVSLSVNTESDRYVESTTEALADKEAVIKDSISQTIRGYTKDELLNNTSEVQNEILVDLQKMFESDYVVGVSFPEMTVD